MIYQYLINYAEKNSSLVVMAINAFLMDCKSGNGKIRGLALRSLCSLKFEGVADYTLSPISEGLDDIDPYVKKTAIIGCIKMYRNSRKEFKGTDFIKKLYKLVFDPSPLVVINSISALNEIEEKKGGCEPTQEIVITLLNRIKDFNEWGQSIILDLVAKFDPDSEDLKFDIMNLLEDRLKHASSSVLLGAVKVFINLTKSDKVLSKDVYERLAAPLITIMASAGTTENYEICYNVISHIYFLCLKGAGDYFKYDYKQFFLKYEEPSYIKFLKLDVISLIAREENVQEIITELEEYVSDANAEIAKKSIRCFGDIVIRLDNFNDNISIIKNFLSLKTDYITSECILVLKNIFRKYREAIEEFEDFLTNITFDSISEIEAKAAYIWILGEFGNAIDMAPYILERMIEIHKDLQSVEISMELLTSITKLFFIRAPEVKEMLGKFFKFAIADNIDVDLRDRATFYYKLLRTDINLAKQIISGNEEEIGDFYENNFTTKHETHDLYFREDVLKIKTKAIKVRPRSPPKKNYKEDAHEDPTEDLLHEESKKEEEDDANLIDFGEEPVVENRNKPSMIHTPSNNLLDDESEEQQDDDPLGDLIDSRPSNKDQDNLLDLNGDGDGFTDLSDAFSGVSVPKPQPQQPAAPQISLKPTPDLDPNSFQQKWVTLSPYPVIQRKANSAVAPNLQGI